MKKKYCWKNVFLSYYCNVSLSFYRNIACENRSSDEGLRLTKNLLTQNLGVKCWWNWPQDGNCRGFKLRILPNFFFRKMDNFSDFFALNLARYIVIVLFYYVTKWESLRVIKPKISKSFISWNFEKSFCKIMVIMKFG